MKVIFIEDVPNVARAGEAREVADGYGRNYLLPRKLAVLANSQASAVVEAQLKKIAKRQAETEAEMAELAGKLDGMEITLTAKAGAKDRLYGSITSADIADELSQSAGLVVDKRKIELEEPIHQLGRYDVTARFTHDIAAVIKLMVVSDRLTEEKEEEKVEVKSEKEEKKKAKAGKKVKEKVENKADEAKTEEEVKETVEEKIEATEEVVGEAEGKEIESGE